MAIFIIPNTEGGTFNGGTLSSGLVLASGTTTVAPLTFASGTNLTTATSGSIEYDGKVFYSTPANRGVSPSKMYYRLNSAYVGSNATGAQSLFGVGITLNANTIDAVESYFVLQKTTGTNSHTVGLLYGGTATTNNFGYQAIGLRDSISNTGGSNQTMGSVSSWGSVPTTNIPFTGAVTSSVHVAVLQLKGNVSINAGGTFIPQYQLSSAPGGAYSTLAASYFAIWPIGTAGTNTSVGPWS